MSSAISKEIYNLMDELRSIYINEDTPKNFAMKVLSLNDKYDSLRKRAKDERDSEAMELLEVYRNQKKDCIKNYFRRDEEDSDLERTVDRYI
ncbi:MAG: hypothetical protein WDZ62_02390 [Candidatus Pacearchaeota archaeon]